MVRPDPKISLLRFHTRSKVGLFLLFRLGLLLVVAGLSSAFVESAAGQQQPPEPLKVAVKEIVPFVFKDAEGKLTGFSIDLWHAIADELNMPFEYVEVETVGEQLEAVRVGRADVAIAGISITGDRARDVDFSLPYYRAGLQIMAVQDNSLAIGDFVQALLSPTALAVLLGFFVIILIVAHVLWLFERHNNPDFPRGYLKGIWASIWWATVTITTVGYGDTTPRGAVGRLIALFWMLAGIFLIANFTASITSVVTTNHLKNQIHDVRDLWGRSTVTIEGSTSEDYLRHFNLKPQTVSTVDEAYEMLRAGTADAVVYDAPVLRYYARFAGGGNLRLVGSVFNPEDYGIALELDSELRKPINVALLRLQENGSYGALEDRWFGTE
jgi:ABC-type amino acid transport substrate-binding protein